jgi:hypothetical protein
METIWSHGRSKRLARDPFSHGPSYPRAGPAQQRSGEGGACRRWWWGGRLGAAALSDGGGGDADLGGLLGWNATMMAPAIGARTTAVGAMRQCGKAVRAPPQPQVISQWLAGPKEQPTPEDKETTDMSDSEAEVRPRWPHGDRAAGSCPCRTIGHTLGRPIR